jgi:hypothetical protein
MTGEQDHDEWQNEELERKIGFKRSTGLGVTNQALKLTSSLL